MIKQLTHEEFKQKQLKIKNNIIFVLENFEHEENIGSAFRLADSFNISKIIIINKNKIQMKKIEKTARNCEKYIPYEIVDTTENAFNILTKSNFVPICVEICNESKSLRSVDFSKYEKGIALIMGNEKHGVSQEALNMAKCCVHIDMYGNNSSMNVSTALAIVTYKVSEDINEKN